ncbi:MAG: hypothetical protein AAF485_21910, partial [Chloroflexota bacterium]
DEDVSHHQLSDEAQAAKNHLFKPRDVVRTPLHIFAGFLGSEAGKSYHVTLGQNATYYQKTSETGHIERSFLDAGEDPQRGATIAYYLEDKPEGDVTLTILDGDGNEIETFSSNIPEKKEEREGLYITAEAGLNSFQWPMNYPNGEKLKGDVEKRPSGPLAPPGAYSVKLTVGDWSMTESFALLKDPRVEMSDSDFADQFAFLRKIQDKLSEMVATINEIRSVKDQVAGWSERLKGHDKGNEVTEAADALKEKLEAVEKALIQVEFKSPGDRLNYRTMLYDKLEMLPSVVGSADAPPTAQSYKVYDKLSGQADEQIAAFKAILDEDLAAFNTLLGSLDVSLVMPPV